ncbi:MAG: hypothetical protein GX446_16545 [Chthonomonadales bacterium]|nr:hypothetical protein [Chthonomonadales bacterium]
MTVAACAAAFALASAMAATPQEVPLDSNTSPVGIARYGVAETLWPVELGHHRAIVVVREAAPAVRVRIPWRRRDRDPQNKDIVVINEATGQRVTNVVRLQITRAYGDIAFEAAAPGVYAVYYLPYEPVLNQYYYSGKGYTPPSFSASAPWVEANALRPEDLPGEAWRRLPEASVDRLEARTQFDSLYPMEVVATEEEVAALVARNPQPFLLFPEDRRFPIRMPDDLPVRWIERGPTDTFHGDALRNEFYTFQIGVYASVAVLTDLKVAFSDLRSSGATIPASALRCFNMGGVDTDGRPFRKRVDVPQGRVQALWIGVDLPRSIAPGDYTGSVSISAEGVPAATVSVTISVGSDVLEDRGDGELWRHSRLRWLDSSAGIDDEVVAPYTPLRVSGRTVRCLGRTLQFGPDGLPVSIKSGQVEVLAAPMRLSLSVSGAPVTLSPGRARIVSRKPGVVSWEAQRSGSGLTISCRADMEFDGHVLYRITLKADRRIALTDASLEIPMRSEVARYFMGAGRKGGVVPKAFDWRWTSPHDSFWMGDVPAGIHCELRGGHYHGPLLNLHRPAPPPSWGNGGKGGVTLVHSDGSVTAKTYSGDRTLEAGEELTFEFALIITPVKPLDTAGHFRTRYYHGGDKPVITDYTLGSGINVINIHHANAVNPYINYPFLTVEPLRALVQKWQERGMKVKIYYTVRELSNYMVELWALRSLGTEILTGGPGGGFMWLREHLVSDYTTQWYNPYPDGTVDASLLNSGESRWYNYYIEGLACLGQHVGMDGLYLDDVSYDRRILKRMRKVMAASRPGSMIDLHSNTGFSIGPANQYMEFMPYVDRIWFGESFRYNEEPPDYWLTEVSGIPFGVMGEMLNSPTNAYRGMVYGITNRITWDAPESGEDPRPIFRLWDAFGIDKAKMLGYWDERCPVRTDNPDVLATAYVRKGKTLIALASWAASDTTVRLNIDWKAVGLDPTRAVLRAPAVRGVQDAAEFAPDAPIPVQRLKGWMLVLEETKR